MQTDLDHLASSRPFPRLIHRLAARAPPLRGPFDLLLNAAPRMAATGQKWPFIPINESVTFGFYRHGTLGD